MQNSQITIESVANEFAIWRQNKKTHFERIPQNLVLLIKQLTTNYPAMQIARALELSKTTIYSIKNNCEHDSTTPEPQPKFLPFKLLEDNYQSKINNQTKPSNTPHAPGYHKSSYPPNQDITDPSNSLTTCQILKNDGSKLIIQTDNISIIANAINTFLCCS